MRYILLLLLFVAPQLSGQTIVTSTKKAQLTMQSKTIDTQEQNAVDGTDSIWIYPTTRRVTIDSLKDDDGNSAIIYDSLAVYGDSLRLLFDYERDVVGGFTKYFYAYHTGYGSPDTSIVDYIISYPHVLVLEDDTMNFGTPSIMPDEQTFTVYNYSVEDISVTSFSGLDYPFQASINWAGSGKILADSSREWVTSFFTPITGGTYVDTMYIYTADSTYSVVFYGIYGGSGTTLESIANFSVDDTLDGFDLTWDNCEGAIGYYLYYKATDAASWDSVFYNYTGSEIEATVDYDNPSFREYLDFDFYVKAYNNNEESISDTLTENSVVTADAYFISSSGGDTYPTNDGLTPATAWSTIEEYNDHGSANFRVYYLSGDTLSDQPLEPFYGSYHTTYGGTTKAIIGDSTGANINNNTISIYAEQVTLNNLRIYSWKDSYQGIRFYGESDLEISDCEIIGGENTHTRTSKGIELIGLNDTVSNVLITRNVIRDWGQGGIYIRPGHNIEISYNTMSNFWFATSSATTTARANYGGSAINKSGGLVPGYTYNSDPSDNLPRYWDAEYTVHIHHNDISDFEYVAIASDFSRVLIEYNYIHDNKDERIYRGGVKHGGIGKLYDMPLNDDSQYNTGFIGSVVRYNYFYNLKRWGGEGYKYAESTQAMRVAGTQPAVLSTAESITTYVLSNATGTGDFINTADGGISGLGYCKMWVHNNIFENMTSLLFRRGYTNRSSVGVYNKQHREDMTSYFVNNTAINCGTHKDLTTSGGVFNTEVLSQSDHVMINNIVDFNNDDAWTAGSYSTIGLTARNNIYTSQNSGIELSSGASGLSDGDNYAYSFTWGVTPDLIENDQYDTGIDNVFADTSNTVFASNLGVSGVYIPDVRITESSYAYNTGYDYDLIGDTETIDMTGNQWWTYTGVLGEDGEGRSYAYDILGDLRDSNSVGAVGFGLDATEEPISEIPVIASHPVSVEIDSGESATLSVSVEPGLSLSYEWYKYEFTKLSDGGEYSGTATRTLTINPADYDNEGSYYCRVTNLDCSIESCVTNSNTAYLTVNAPTGATAHTDTLTVDAGTDDFYLTNIGSSEAFFKLTESELTFGLNRVYDPTFYDMTLGIRLTGMYNYETITSAKLYFKVKNAYTEKKVFTVKAEATATPSTFSTRADWDSRSSSSITETVSVDLQTTTWNADTYYYIDVIDIIEALDADYTYSDGEIVLFFDNVDTRNQVKLYSYEGSFPPFLEIIGTR